jgi:hypothetical protein
VARTINFPTPQVYDFAQTRSRQRQKANGRNGYWAFHFGLRFGKRLAKHLVISGRKSPIPNTVSRTPNTPDRIVRAQSLRDSIGENSAKQTDRARCRPYPPFYDSPASEPSFDIYGGFPCHDISHEAVHVGTGDLLDALSSE